MPLPTAADRRKARQVTAEWRAANADRPNVSVIDRLLVESFIRTCPTHLIDQIVADVRAALDDAGFERQKSRKAVGLRIRKLRTGLVDYTLTRRAAEALARQSP